MDSERNREIHRKWKAESTFVHSTAIGSEYQAEQVEWLRAVDRWMVENGRRPDYAEVLQIAKNLGYQKP